MRRGTRGDRDAVERRDDQHRGERVDRQHDGSSRRATTCTSMPATCRRRSPAPRAATSRSWPSTRRRRRRRSPTRWTPHGQAESAAPVRNHRRRQHRLHRHGEPAPSPAAVTVTLSNGATITIGGATSGSRVAAVRATTCTSTPAVYRRRSRAQPAATSKPGGQRHGHHHGSRRCRHDDGEPSATRAWPKGARSPTPRA